MKNNVFNKIKRWVCRPLQRLVMTPEPVKMDMINYIKNNAKKNTVWIDITGGGWAIAQHLKAKGVPVNIFTIADQQKLKQHLDHKEHENHQCCESCV